MSSTRNPGRVAGFLYLLLLAAPLRLVYIPSKLIVTGNATATATNIAAHELLFRFGIVADLFTGVMALFLTLALYRLLKGVDQGLAVLMVILGSLMVTPIYFLNTMASESTRSFGGYGSFPLASWCFGRASSPASWASG